MLLKRRKFLRLTGLSTAGSVMSWAGRGLTETVKFPPGPIFPVSHFKVWVNAFIPRDITGFTTEVKRGEYQGQTVIPGPAGSNMFADHAFGMYSYYLTDQRTFSSDPWEKRSKAHAEIIVRLPGGEVETPSGQSTGSTAFDSSWNKVCHQPPFEIPEMGFFNTDIQQVSDTFIGIITSFQGGGVNRCAGLDGYGVPQINPQLEVRILMTAQRNGRTKITVNVTGEIETFPAYEMYCSISYAGQPVTKEIFALPPVAGATPWGLVDHFQQRRKIDNRAEIVLPLEGVTFPTPLDNLKRPPSLIPQPLSDKTPNLIN